MPYFLMSCAWRWNSCILFYWQYLSRRHFSSAGKTVFMRHRGLISNLSYSNQSVLQSHIKDIFFYSETLYLQYYQEFVFGIWYKSNLFSSSELNLGELYCLYFPCCLSVNFKHFQHLLQSHWANFNKIWHPLAKGIQSFENKGPRHFSRGDNYK